MPRYYLSVRHNGHLYRDEEGEEAPTDLEITIRARETARDLIGRRLTPSPTGSTAPWRSRTRAGRAVLSLPFTDAVD